MEATEYGPWYMAPNRRTGRMEVFRRIANEREMFVGSMPGDPTDEEIREMIQRLKADPRCN